MTEAAPFVDDMQVSILGTVETQPASHLAIFVLRFPEEQHLSDYLTTQQATAGSRMSLFKTVRSSWRRHICGKRAKRFLCLQSVVFTK